MNNDFQTSGSPEGWEPDPPNWCLLCGHEHPDDGRHTPAGAEKWCREHYPEDYDC